MRKAARCSGVDDGDGFSDMSCVSPRNRAALLAIFRNLFAACLAEAARAGAMVTIIDKATLGYLFRVERGEMFQSL